MRGVKIADIDLLGQALLFRGSPVDTGHWQSLKGVPQTKTIELAPVIFELQLPDSIQKLQDATQCSLPWAEEQFQERVRGVPLNPGETYKKWPWYRGNVETHRRVDLEVEDGIRYFETHQKHVPDMVDVAGYPVDISEPENVPTHQSVVDEHTVARFSHTYMERFWPKCAGWKACHGGATKMEGIRYRYGDLNDVVSLLAKEPYTRQAYLPVFFPEDTGAHHGERVPCTLGYHFLLREGKLHINYFIRSCDYLRHFRDDVYLAGRLCQWIVHQLIVKEAWTGATEQALWGNVTPGTLTMFISSLHVFEGDLPKMRREYG